MHVYRAALYARGLSYGNAVRPSHACFVIKRTKLLPTFLHRMKGKFINFFGHKEWLIGDVPFYLKFLVKTGPI